MRTEVCIIGCGPIGLSSALLLARHGVSVLLLEKRGELNTHPRSRFVDVNTMELMRLFGIEKEVENTGLGPDWTGFNRWSTSLLAEDCVSIASPSFHTVPSPVSPCLPVMTCQDYVETELLKRVHETPGIDCRFNTEARDLMQDDDTVRLTIFDNIRGEATNVEADYLIGADGPHSRTRQFIASQLDAKPLPMYSQDVIFQADMSKQVGARKGSLLYCITPAGVTAFQPLDGIRRWRCQIFKFEEADLNETEIKQRIQMAIGDDTVALDITSTGHWQPTPGCTDKFRDGRIFLAGDAAHVTLPTGGMGNNIGFTGARNLAWKLAYVLKGKADAKILVSYEQEMRPAALKRVQHGVSITDGMRELIVAIMSGEATDEGAHATRFYADYNNIILGHEYVSPLIAAHKENASSDEEEDDDKRISRFEPQIRNGRRAPHIWLDDKQQQSTCDLFDDTYVLLVGKSVDAKPWRTHIAKLAGDFPITLHHMVQADALGIYPDNGLIVVRPDGVIVDHWRDGELSDDESTARLARHLPKCSGTGQ